MCRSGHGGITDWTVELQIDGVVCTFVIRARGSPINTDQRSLTCKKFYFYLRVLDVLQSYDVAVALAVTEILTVVVCLLDFFGTIPMCSRFTLLYLQIRPN